VVDRKKNGQEAATSFDRTVRNQRSWIGPVSPSNVSFRYNGEKIFQEKPWNKFSKIRGTHLSK
jgi:hypothetical protein